MLDHLTKLFDRDLTRLSNEIMTYPEEDDLWVLKGEISNSSGNLCLHILGNLNHFIGAVLGDTEYERNREVEFSGKGIPRTRLLQEIKEINEIIRKILGSIKDEDLDKPYPINVFEDEMTTVYFLIHLHGHLNYHLGQINYHRRMLIS